MRTKAKAKVKPRIVDVKLYRKIDDLQLDHTSHLGEYANRPTSEYSIDRQERNDMERNEYRYFNPSSNYVDKHDKLRDGITPDECRTYVEQDYKRMESLNRGDWCYVGIYAIAHVQLLDGGPVQEIHSVGLWGIESDSDDSYFNDVRDKEIGSLIAQLQALGCSEQAIQRAVKLAVENGFEE